MRVRTSVLIPTYNGARTIRATLDSVLKQSVPPDEILVLDDGSTDDTVTILKSFGSRLRLLQQENQGVATVRNKLCGLASGDLLAFLDQDDLWHPRYLEYQRQVFSAYPDAVAFFTGHVNFRGHGPYYWNENDLNVASRVEMIGPPDFLQRYNRATGPFASMSYCCVPRAVLNCLGPEPFRISGVDDSFLFTLLPLKGPIAYSAEPLVAYRVTNEAQSVNRVKSFGRWVNVFESLREDYRKQTDPELRKAFSMAFASKRRQYGKLLMAAERFKEARAQFWRSACEARSLASVGKSLGLLLSSYLPSFLQPNWPPTQRD